MNDDKRPVILVDPHPRHADDLFCPQTRARLEQLGCVVWHDGVGRAAPDEIVESHLKNGRVVERLRLPPDIGR